MLSANLNNKPLNTSGFKALQKISFYYANNNLTPEQKNDLNTNQLLDLHDMLNEGKKPNQKYMFVQRTKRLFDPKNDSIKSVITGAILITGVDIKAYRKKEKEGYTSVDKFLNSAPENIYITPDADTPTSDQVKVVTKPDLKLEYPFST